MKSFFVLHLLLYSTNFLFCQSNCGCEKDSSIKEFISCDTIILANKSLLYYQVNCDTLWLTFENIDKKKKTLFSMGTELGSYNYRLGFQLIKEFKKSLLFRYGCPASGPCEHVLIDKTSGKQTKEFHELIYTSEDNPTNFIIYFADTSLNHLALYYVDTEKRYIIKVPGNRFIIDPVPEQQFESTYLEGNILTLTYHYRLHVNDDDLKKDTIRINLNKYTQ